jgi:hypothetical protein
MGFYQTQMVRTKLVEESITENATQQTPVRPSRTRLVA